MNPRTMTWPGILLAFQDLSSRPRRWVEVSPYVWQDRTSHDRLAAQVENGRAVRWGFDLPSPFMVFDRVPMHRSGIWFLPVSYVALPALAPSSARFRVFRWTRIAVGLVLAALATSRTDGLPRFAQWFGLAAFVAGVLVGAWNVIHFVLYVAGAFHLIGMSVRYR